MNSVSIPLQKTPRTFVKKYVSTRMGFNVRIGNVVENKNGTWTVSLNAVIPSFVKLNDAPSRTFSYVFDNVGKAIVKYDDYDFDFVETPKAKDMDLVLMKKIDLLTLKVQQEILDYGKFKWGKLSSIRHWMGSIHGIISRCIRETSFPSDNVSKKYTEYFEFLRSNNWIRIEGRNSPQIVASNDLTKLHEILLNDNLVKDDPFSISDAIIGHIFAKHYVQIRDELKIRAPASYVTTTKAYYADAVREGRAIPMDQNTLLSKFRTYHYTAKSPTYKGFRFPDIVSELVTNNFFSYTKDQKSIIAVNELLDRLLPYQEELAQNVMET